MERSPYNVVQQKLGIIYDRLSLIHLIHMDDNNIEKYV